MNHAINSKEFKIQTKGFRDGASISPMDPIYDSVDIYSRAYMDGQKAYRAYADKLCKQLRLIDPVITQAKPHERTNHTK